MRAITTGKFLSCLAACALLAVSTPSFGATLVSETFTPDGALAGQTPEVGGVWTTHSGTAGQMQVVSGQARVSHAQSEDLNTAFAGGAIGAGDVIYSGFDLTVPAQTAAPNNVYFAHFKDAGNFFGSRVWITAPSVVGAGYRLGITGDSSLEVANDLFPSNLAFDTTYRVVTSYNFDTGESRLWVNPVNQASTSVLSDDSFAGDLFLSYALRESTANSVQLIDNLRVNTNFVGALSIPEPATLALVFVAGLGVVGLRRRG